MKRKESLNNSSIYFLASILFLAFDFVFKSFSFMVFVGHYFKTSGLKEFSFSINSMNVIIDGVNSFKIYELPFFDIAFGLSSLTVLMFSLVSLKIFNGLSFLSFKIPRFSHFLFYLSITFLFVLFFIYSEYKQILPRNDFLTNEVFTHNNLFLLIFSIGIVTPIFEEIIFRGLIQRAISDKFGYVSGIVSASLFFTFLHVQYELISILFVLSISILLGLTRHYTKSLVLPIVIHVIFNSVGLVILYFSPN